jgi:hypothetical protein
MPLAVGRSLRWGQPVQRERAYADQVDEAEASGQAWMNEVLRRPTAEQDRDALARLVEWDADPFEIALYERAADPQGILIDRAQRSRTGQHARHVRRRDRDTRRTVISK